MRAAAARRAASRAFFFSSESGGREAAPPETLAAWSADLVSPELFCARHDVMVPLPQMIALTEPSDSTAAIRRSSNSLA